LSREPSRRELTAALPLALRETLAQLSTFNQTVGTPLGLNAMEFLCLDLVGRHEPVTPGRLAAMCGLRPATMTGMLDRLEAGGWVVRERDAQDRRRVFVRAQHERAGDLGQRLGRMRRALRDISKDYSENELQLILGFLHSVSQAAMKEAEALRSADMPK
jgi:DNA-binding MarR family transcriptional regulator